MTRGDLALELGLSAHLQMSDIEVDDAIAQMWAVRQSVLEAGAMDPSAEPIPFGGRDERLELLNMVIYLGNLLERAATLNDCDRDAIVARALVRPVIQQLRAPSSALRQLRTS
jgi:hypothetical protein